MHISIIKFNLYCFQNDQSFVTGVSLVKGLVKTDQILVIFNIKMTCYMDLNRYIYIYNMLAHSLNSISNPILNTGKKRQNVRAQQYNNQVKIMFRG